MRRKMLKSICAVVLSIALTVTGVNVDGIYNAVAGSQETVQKETKITAEQKEKIINHFKDFKELNYDIVNSFIDYIEIGEKNKKANSQDVVIHWNF